MDGLRVHFDTNPIGFLNEFDMVSEGKKSRMTVYHVLCVFISCVSFNSHKNIIKLHDGEAEAQGS